MSTPPAARRRGLVFVYALWAALWVLAGLVGLEIHALLIAAALRLSGNPWVTGAVRQLAFPVLGLLWLIFIFWQEYWLRAGWRRGLLRCRVARTLAALAAIWAVAFAARALLR
ncbi:MAG TPA: hypothetical protein VNL77_20975 [Roseiflexaceae bacterium]|nr:hypothetical protein [Roseiflexaceae bacterium]